MDEYMCEYCGEMFPENEMTIIDDWDANKCDHCHEHHEALDKGRKQQQRREEQEREYWRKREEEWSERRRQEDEDRYRRLRGY